MEHPGAWEPNGGLSSQPLVPVEPIKAEKGVMKGAAKPGTTSPRYPVTKDSSMDFTDGLMTIVSGRPFIAYGKPWYRKRQLSLGSSGF
ncbi:hypothetical protein BH24CHL1_BH24CHL1_12690 [soil metagenome]